MWKSDYEPAAAAAKPTEVLWETLSINHVYNTSPLRKSHCKEETSITIIVFHIINNKWVFNWRMRCTQSSSVHVTRSWILHYCPHYCCQTLMRCFIWSSLHKIIHIIPMNACNTSFVYNSCRLKEIAKEGGRTVWKIQLELQFNIMTPMVQKLYFSHLKNLSRL